MDWKEELREHWPFALGALILIFGHIYLYIIQGVGWEPISPPLLIAITVVIVIEIGRSVIRSRSDSE